MSVARIASVTVADAALQHAPRNFAAGLAPHDTRAAAVQLVRSELAHYNEDADLICRMDQADRVDVGGALTTRAYVAWHPSACPLNVHDATHLLDAFCGEHAQARALAFVDASLVTRHDKPMVRATIHSGRVDNRSANQEILSAYVARHGHELALKRLMDATCTCHYDDDDGEEDDDGDDDSEKDEKELRACAAKSALASVRVLREVDAATEATKQGRTSCILWQGQGESGQDQNTRDATAEMQDAGAAQAAKAAGTCQLATPQRVTVRVRCPHVLAAWVQYLATTDVEGDDAVDREKRMCAWTLPSQEDVPVSVPVSVSGSESMPAKRRRTK